MSRTLPYQLTDKLFVLGNKLFTTYLLRGETCSLLDLASSGAALLVQEQLWKLGIRNEKVEWLVVQHAHWDHVCALPYFRQFFPRAKVLGSQKASEVLGKTKIVDQFRQNDERWCSRLKEQGVFAQLAHACRRLREEIVRLVTRIQAMAAAGAPEERQLEELFRVSYRDLLTELYLPEYLRNVSPFYLKAILAADPGVA